MIPFIIQQWEENKHKLEEYFKTTNQDQYDSYEIILRKVFELCIPNAGDHNMKWSIKDLTVIDHGQYQGTQIYIIPMSTYQPDESEYIWTHNTYGSCSGCDTLEGISLYGDELPSEDQVKEYMILSLHLVQKIKWLNQREDA